MKLTDMRKKKTVNLEKHAAKLREDIALARRERYTKDVSNSKVILALRKELARTLTVLNEQTDEKEEE